MKSISAVKLSSGREVLPASEKAHEVSAGNWLDLFTQAAQSQAMDPRENPAMAKLSLVRSELALQNQAFRFEFGKTDFDGLQRQTQSVSEGRRRRGADRVDPAT